MCHYWKKIHLCGCLSRPYLFTCRPALVARNTCAPRGELPELETPTASHFQCFNCLVKEQRAETEATNQAAAEAAEAERLAAEEAARKQKEQERKEREERVRREAIEKARLEREEEARVEAERKTQIEREKREGGAWSDVPTFKKGRGKGRKVNGGTQSVPISPILTTSPASVVSPPSSAPLQVSTPSKGGGRAGVWGPSRK